MQMQETKTSRARVAFALLCGLAVCCSIMYITADGESVLSDDAPHSTGSGQDIFAPKSIESVDVKKTGLLYTKTPDTLKHGPEGRQRLLTFLDKVEANIAKEVEARKDDIAAIRAQMAKNMAYNADARKKMKTMLLAKMAKNAAKAKADLAEAMRQTQEKFAKAAKLENKRQRQTIRRSKKTREIMRKNKAEGAKNLAMAVSNQQRALATLASATNARIKKSNKAIAANAAQIKENAKKARKDLESAMNRFDHKMANVNEEAKKGRSKLAAQAADQDKKFREYANNRVKAIAAKTSAQFHKVRDTMAKDRHHADQALSHTSARMDAALNAAKALQDKRFAQTVSDIAEAKKEANDRVEKFRSSFKTDILHLSGVVEEQSNKLNTRMTQLAGTVESNKAEQAHLNAQVGAELKRMVKVGNDRYSEHLKKDKELKSLMAKNKADTEKQMTDMSEKFYAQMADIKAQMKKDRAHAEHSLSTSTDGLFKTLADNQQAQDAVNKELTAATRRAKLDAEAALKEAKEGFTAKVAALHETVKSNEKKHNKKVMDLTGVVAANAIKDAQGRAELKKISDFNKNTMKKAVADAVHKGEQRALQIEKKMKDINAKTRVSMNNRITTEISTLSKSIHSQIDELNLQTKEARAQMKAEILFAIKSAASIAKDNLKKTVEWAEGEFAKLNTGLQNEAKLSEGERAAMAQTVAKDKAHAQAQIENAVAAQNKALSALTQETESEIKKTNKALTAQVDIMIANNDKVRSEMKANTAALVASLEAARKSADEQLASVNAASAARYDEVVKAVEDGIESARVKADARFTGVYGTMLEDRKKYDEKVAGAVAELNDSIAKNSAIEDARFAKTVKDIDAARKESRTQVAQARKNMATAILTTTAKAKDLETRILGDLQVVSAMVVSDKAAQIKINQKVDAEMDRLIEKSNDYESTNKARRGVIRKMMDEYKQAAAQETAELAKESRADVKKLRSEQAATLLQFKTDLTESTEHVYDKLSKDNAAQEAALSNLKGSLGSAKAQSAASLGEAKAVFASRVEALNGAITANANHFEARFSETTGVVNHYKEAGDADRENIRIMRDGMVADLNKNIVRAIELGEAKIKAVEENANLNIATERKALLTTIATAVENMADNVFKVSQENRQKIADNYLSLKAYAATAADLIADYLQKGKGRNLSSVGDLLNTVAGLSTVETKPAQGMGFGGDSLPLIFSGETIKVDNAVSKINGLVNEYIDTIGQVKERWPLGLGHYLLAKLEIAMSKAGALEVDKIEGKSGNYVFMNAHSVGLSSKLSDFEGLAVRMANYEHTLASLTGKLPKSKSAGQKQTKVPPPEWQGN
jgi:hypothetical protein